MQTAQTNVGPWYREPWPWLLMAGPAVVIVAGFVTLWLAISSSDGLVADDYYKQGLAINRTLDRDALALKEGYRASVNFDAPSRTVRLRLNAAIQGQLPEALTLRVVHPTRAGQDLLMLLRRSVAGDYTGISSELPEGRRLLLLEDVRGAWRLTGTVVFPSDDAVVLSASTVR